MKFSLRFGAWAVLACVTLLVAVIAAAARMWILDERSGIYITFADGEPAGRSEWDLLSHRSDYALQACCVSSTQLVSSESPAGRRARMFRVSPSDPMVKGSFRSELRLRPHLVGQHVWYRASVRVPPNWVATSEKVLAMQWHGTRDWLFLEPGKVPPLEIAIIGNKWEVQKSWDGRLVTPRHGAVEGLRRIGEARLRTGRWLQWTVEVKWSSDADGFIRAWLDNDLVVDDRGPNAHRDFIGPYLKVGVYVPGWHYRGREPGITERLLYFSDILVRPVT